MKSTLCTERKERFARYPSCFGKLDCQGLCDVARGHGMQIISAIKPDMHAYNEIGLYGTKSQMRATERDWTTAGNKLKPRNFTAVFGVDLRVQRKDWVDTCIAKARANAIEVHDGWPCNLNHSKETVLAPEGFRLLRKNELPCETDVAWNAGAQVWQPIDVEGLSDSGPATFKRQAFAILRRKRGKK